MLAVRVSADPRPGGPRRLERGPGTRRGMDRINKPLASLVLLEVQPETERAYMIVVSVMPARLALALWVVADTRQAPSLASTTELEPTTAPQHLAALETICNRQTQPHMERGRIWAGFQEVSRINPKVSYNI